MQAEVTETLETDEQKGVGEKHQQQRKKVNIHFEKSRVGYIYKYNDIEERANVCQQKR